MILVIILFCLRRGFNPGAELQVERRGGNALGRCQSLSVAVLFCATLRSFEKSGQRRRTRSSTAWRQRPARQPCTQSRMRSAPKKVATWRGPRVVAHPAVVVIPLPHGPR